MYSTTIKTWKSKGYTAPFLSPPLPLSLTYPLSKLPIPILCNLAFVPVILLHCSQKTQQMCLQLGPEWLPFPHLSPQLLCAFSLPHLPALHPQLGTPAQSCSLPSSPSFTPESHPPYTLDSHFVPSDPYLSPELHISYFQGARRNHPWHIQKVKSLPSRLRYLFPPGRTALPLPKHLLTAAPMS